MRSLLLPAFAAALAAFPQNAATPTPLRLAQEHGILRIDARAVVPMVMLQTH